MAELGDLRLKVSADVNDLLQQMQRGSKSLSDFTSQLGRFKSQLNTATDPQSIVRLNQAIAATKQKIDDIGKAGIGSNLPASVNKTTDALNKVQGSSDKAGFALLNLGRIAQDAPFGFIGIQNNINPLLESFQRLKAESGSTKGALAAMAGALTGGAGLGLAVSVVTSLLTVLTQQGLFKSAKATEDAKKKTDEYASSLKSIGDSLAKEAVDVSLLVKAIQSDTLSRQQKAEAIKELKRISPDYFGQLVLENGLVKNLEASYRGYLNALKEKFATKALDIQLEKLFNRKLDLEVSLDKGAFSAIDKETSDRINRLNAQIEKAGGIKILANADPLNYTKAQTEVEKLSRAILNLQSKNKIERIVDTRTSNDLNNVNKEIDGLLSRRSQLGNFDIKPIKDKTVKDVRDFGDVIKDLRDNLKGIGIEFEFGEISPKEKDIKSVKAYIDAFKELTSINAVSAPKVIAKLQLEIDPEQNRVALDQALKKFKVEDFLAKRELPNPIEIIIPVNPKLVLPLKEFQKQGVDISKSINDIMVSTLSGVASSFAEGIAKVITGDGSVGDAFKSILTQVADGIIEMGKSLVALGIAKTAVEKFNIVPGPGSILAGIGVQILGNLLKNSLPKFAAGGVVTGPMQAIVGEAGPEAIIPLDKLKNFAGGGGDVFIPNNIIRGDDLITVFQRAQAKRSRNT